MMIIETKKLIVTFLLGLSLIMTTALRAEEQDSAEIGVAKELYAAFVAGDMDKVMSLYSPEVVFIFHGPEDVLPHAGTFKGRQGVAEFFSELSQSIQVTAIDQRLFSQTNNVVSVLGWETGVALATGGEYRANWVHVITVEDGLITHFEEVTDSGAIADALAPADPERGKAYYTTCLGCHGVEGQGQWSMHAPGLSLQSSEYLLRQLRNFRSQARGGVQDFYGWQMNGRATALSSDRAIRDVLAYIDTLPDVVANDRVDGNKRKGKKLYQANCASCHGDKGIGNAELDSPRLAGVEGWYQIEQLTKFKSGLRGSSDGDIAGNQMRAAVALLQDDQDIRDVTAYIMTLAK